MSMVCDITGETLLSCGSNICKLGAVEDMHIIIIISLFKQSITS
jgi:hypothetical protein